MVSLHPHPTQCSGSPRNEHTRKDIYSKRHQIISLQQIPICFAKSWVVLFEGLHRLEALGTVSKRKFILSVIQSCLAPDTTLRRRWTRWSRVATRGANQLWQGGVMPCILLHLLNSFLTKELQIRDVELFCYKAQKGTQIFVFGCYIRQPFYKSRWCPNDLTLESRRPFLLLSQKINQQIHRPPGQTQSVYYTKTGGCLKESSGLWSSRWVPWYNWMPLPQHSEVLNTETPGARAIQRPSWWGKICVTQAMTFKTRKQSPTRFIQPRIRIKWNRH